jgi:excinuclease UvrABC ATPase subunit
MFRKIINSLTSDKKQLQDVLELECKDAIKTVTERINTSKNIHAVLDAGVGVVTTGRSTILHHHCAL